MPATEDVIITTSARVMNITLNRPEKHNAYTAEMRARVFEAIRQGDESDEIGCIVLKGAGRSFSSGFDLGSERGLQDDPNYRNDYERTIQQDIRSLSVDNAYGPSLWYLQTPIIAQVQGYCLAGAFELATNCDLIVAAEDAKFGYPIVRTMASPPTHMFTYLAGPQLTKYLLLTGDLIDGTTAAAHGLALWAVPEEQLDERVTQLANRIATAPPELSAINKAICEKALDAMGRPMVQRLALEADTVAHKAPTLQEFYEVGKRHGHKAALAALDRYR